MINLSGLHKRIAAVCPIDGVDPAERMIWFRGEATQAQRDAAYAVLDAFDPAAEEQKQQKQRALADTDGPFVRVLEDLLAVLVSKGAIKLTDLPQSARDKLAARQALRAELGE